MEKFKEACSEAGVSDDKPSKLEGKFYAAVLYPKSPKPEKAQNKGGNNEKQNQNT